MFWLSARPKQKKLLCFSIPRRINRRSNALLSVTRTPSSLNRTKNVLQRSDWPLLRHKNSDIQLFLSALRDQNYATIKGAGCLGSVQSRVKQTENSSTFILLKFILVYYLLICNNNALIQSHSKARVLFLEWWPRNFSHRSVKQRLCVYLLNRNVPNMLKQTNLFQGWLN